MQRQAPVQSVSSFEAFLVFEETATERHEFVDGNLFVMAGGTDRHDHVAGGLYSRLFLQAFERRNFQVYKGDVKIRTPDEIGYYPDVFVLTETSLDTPRVKRSPAVIVEVLSESTEAIDRGEKLRNYRKIPSLEQYFLLSQHQPQGEVYVKQPNGEWLHRILEADALLEMPSIGFSLALTVLYDNLPAE
jgi:Uma2 family endonuclease